MKNDKATLQNFCCAANDVHDIIKNNLKDKKGKKKKKKQKDFAGFSVGQDMRKKLKNGILKTPSNDKKTSTITLRHVFKDLLGSRR